MTTKEWRKEHRRLGLCRYCKLPALNGKGRCSKHYLENLEYGRIFYSLNSERMKIQNDEYRNDHQKKGLCRECTNPIKPGHFFCAVCLEKRRVKSYSKIVFSNDKKKQSTKNKPRTKKSKFNDEPELSSVHGCPVPSFAMVRGKT